MIAFLVAWFKWRRIRADKPRFDYDKGSGYYSVPKPGTVVEMKMPSGGIGIFKFLKCVYYRKPSGMVHRAWYQFDGYKGQKLFKEMSFREFRALQFSIHKIVRGTK